MRIDAASVLAEALQRYRQDRPALNAVAGLFFFVPTLALLAFVDRGAPDAETTEAVAAALQRMLLDNWHWFLGVQLCELMGSAWLFAWLLGKGRPSLGDALRVALPVLPMLVVAVLIVGLVTVTGLMFFLAPGFYAIGRTFLVAPIMLAEPGTSPMKAFERSIRLTQGNGWMLFVMTAAIWLTGQLPNLLLGPLAGAGVAGLIVVTVVTALAGAAVTLAILLVKVAVYARVAESSKQGM